MCSHLSYIQFTGKKKIHPEWLIHMYGKYHQGKIFILPLNFFFIETFFPPINTLVYFRLLTVSNITNKPIS